MTLASQTSRRPRQPFAAVADLCDGFFNVAVESCCDLLREDELPVATRDLLVHRDHMTAVLEARYGAPVELRVLAELRDADHYSRMITLHPRTTPERTVEFGVVRIDLLRLGDAVREEVLARRAPLGDILVRHDVLRRVSPRWYFRFAPGSPIAQRLGPREAFGRVGVIYCDEEPAIELLEVVGAD